MVFHDQKLQRILELLEQRPYWQSKELADTLQVSRSTIQRCLQELEDARLARRVHGGVRRFSMTVAASVPVSQRLSHDHQAKEQMAQAALSIIPSRGMIYLDAGTTLLPLAQRLAEVETAQLVCVTNDIAIAQVLCRLNIDHILLGGKMHQVTQSISGAHTLDQIERFNFDVVLLSADAVDEQFGVTCCVQDEALLKARALQRCDQAYLVASSSKFPQKAPCVIASLAYFSGWISDSFTPAAQTACHNNQTHCITPNSQENVS